MESDEEDLSYGAFAANRKAKKARKDSPRKSRSGSGGANRVKGFNRDTGERNRRYTCGSEYHLAPRRPQRRQWKPDSAPSPPPVDKAPRSSFSSIAIDNSASV